MTGVRPSALAVPSRGHGWAGRREVPPEWRKGAEVKLGAWLWAFAAGEGERERLPWPRAGAAAPSSPSWGCRAGCPAGRETCGGVGGYGDDASAGRRRGCAHWAQHCGLAAGCCGWSTLIRCRCLSASRPRHHLLLHRQREISPLHPQCCRDLYCYDVARPRFLSIHCFGSLRSNRKRVWEREYCPKQLQREKLNNPLLKDRC